MSSSPLSTPSTISMLPSPTYAQRRTTRPTSLLFGQTSPLRYPASSKNVSSVSVPANLCLQAEPFFIIQPQHSSTSILDSVPRTHLQAESGPQWVDPTTPTAATFAHLPVLRRTDSRLSVLRGAETVEAWVDSVEDSPVDSHIDGIDFPELWIGENVGLQNLDVEGVEGGKRLHRARSMIASPEHGVEHVEAWTSPTEMDMEHGREDQEDEGKRLKRASLISRDILTEYARRLSLFVQEATENEENEEEENVVQELPFIDVVTSSPFVARTPTITTGFSPRSSNFVEAIRKSRTTMKGSTSTYERHPSGARYTQTFPFIRHDSEPIIKPLPPTVSTSPITTTDRVETASSIASITSVRSLPVRTSTLPPSTSTSPFTNSGVWVEARALPRGNTLGNGHGGSETITVTPFKMPKVARGMPRSRTSISLLGWVERCEGASGVTSTSGLLGLDHSGGTITTSETSSSAASVMTTDVDGEDYWSGWARRKPRVVRQMQQGQASDLPADRVRNGHEGVKWGRHGQRLSEE
ncbi:hypothetical protein SAICODRAFT_137798 [Saitoella complicata NRRL Y-17804]|uniref:uncharacterized protein n=1 Tax=Saitoella complicata (strain BCRC 22490 / CBS 7301 / JCM 7358 / NBRC 10748 / NRRL Y-17804) TaxID=698492 RepID=UPI000866AB02|nr:uncharacterized protein SAICODRAFT_137798 [Saitoella complicata NRRL Y-17804]ODQ52154.1 hypothetical protein SAICODRAFT_137798 [Saitoella complicata NRRL Y-17804]